MATIQRIDSARSASDLADLLNGNTRRRPVVVVTIPSGRDKPWIDVEQVALEADGLADVFLMETGPHTYEFSAHMVAGTQVYGGAGRVYPVGHAWTSDLHKSPLRFAFDEREGALATERLVSDMLTMAVSAGLVHAAPETLRQVSGRVRAIVARRALVDIGETFPGAVAEELTAPGVPIEQIVTPGQSISGQFDAATGRIDVTGHLRGPEEALADYSVGDVVLTKVVMVKNGKAELELYPRTAVPAVVVKVLRADVTTNPADDLRTLMTVGEVIPARVVGTGPSWSLVLNDVDDDEPVVPAPALLAEGPPWLVEEVPGLLEEETTTAPAFLLPMPSTHTAPAPVAPVAEPEVEVEPATEPAAPYRPTPALLDRNRPRRATPSGEAPTRPTAPAPVAVAPPTESTKGLLLKIDGLKAELGASDRRQEALLAELRASADDREQLRFLVHQAESRANRAEHSLRSARSRLRKAGTGRAGTGKQATSAVEGPQFADAEAGFRYLVLTQWATRTLPSEQGTRPLTDYVVGSKFLASLDRLEGIRPEKVADVVFEIVTGLAPQIPGREVHRLRAGTGGDAPPRTREDGAQAWRASLQVNTPSARRIHYWALPDGKVELACVATHDHFDL